MMETAPTPEPNAVKTPPFLLLAALAFWGWQSGLLLVGVTMGTVLESARFVKARWELSDTDFRRILTFCTVLAFATAIYAFTSNEEGGSLSGLFHGPMAARDATITSVRASTAFFRGLPMTLFLFVAAQSFSAREKIPWTAISIYSRRRAQRERKSSGSPPSGADSTCLIPISLCAFFPPVFTRTMATTCFIGGNAFWPVGHYGRSDQDVMDSPFGWAHWQP